MLKKFNSKNERFYRGSEVYLVTRKGEIIEGFRVANVLTDLVELDRSPIERSEKQGFTIRNNLLKPNWCEGKKIFRAGCATKAEALALINHRNV